MSAKISARTATTTDLPSDIIGTIQGGADRRTVLGMGSVVTPEKYGAVGDGVTDDTTAFQAALTSGAPGVFAKNAYYITTGLTLSPGQILFGMPKTRSTETVGATTPRIIFRPGAANKVAIKNGTLDLTKSCGVQDLIIDCNDNSHTALQFQTTYGVVARRIHFVGTMRIGLLSDDCYVCSYDDLTFVATSVRTACVFIGTGSAMTVTGFHSTSLIPNTVGECLYGIAMSNSGKANQIISPIMQGPTIGIAGAGDMDCVISSMYNEDCVCPLRLGNINQAAGEYVINGGRFQGPLASHTQYGKRGPYAIINASNATFVTPAIEGPPANATARGPWPFVVDNAKMLTLINIYNNNYADGTLYARECVFNRNGSSNVGLTILGSNYSRGTHQAQEVVLKCSGDYGTHCYAIRVDNNGKMGTLSNMAGVWPGSATADVTTTGVTYTPATCFADIDALLRTDLPTGASLVL